MGEPKLPPSSSSRDPGCIESAGPVLFYRRRDDENGSFIFAGGWSREITGHRPALLEGKGGPGLGDLMHPDDRNRVLEAIRSGVSGSKVLRIEYRLRRPDGTVRHVLDRCRAIWNEDGSIEHLEGVIVDPSLSAEDDREARADEQRFRAMMEASLEGIVIHDKGVVLDANPTLGRMLGYTQAELGGKPVMDLIDPKDHEMVGRNVQSGYERPYELLAVRKNGERFPAQVCGRDVLFQGKVIRVVAVRDITIFKEAEESLQRSKERLERTVEERTRELEQRQTELQRINQSLLRELAMARKVQESLLPDLAVLPGDVEVATSYIPALEVGGDAYHVIPLAEGRVAALIADVTGHGIQAALSTVLVTSTFSTHAGKDVTPGEILRNMNAVLRRGLPSGTFTAALVLTLEPGSGLARILGAGIPDPWVVRSDDRAVEAIECRSPLLGVLEDDDYVKAKERTLELGPGDRILLATDGLHEVRNEEGVFFGEAALPQALAGLRDEPHERLPHRLVAAARAFGGPYHAWDDITIVSLKMR